MWKWVTFVKMHISIRTVSMFHNNCGCEFDTVAFCCYWKGEKSWPIRGNLMLVLHPTLCFASTELVIFIGKLSATSYCLCYPFKLAQLHISSKVIAYAIRTQQHKSGCSEITDEKTENQRMVREKSNSLGIVPSESLSVYHSTIPTLSGDFVRRKIRRNVTAGLLRTSVRSFGGE